MQSNQLTSKSQSLSNNKKNLSISGRKQNHRKIVRQQYLQNYFSTIRKNKFYPKQSQANTQNISFSVNSPPRRPPVMQEDRFPTPKRSRSSIRQKVNSDRILNERTTNFQVNGDQNLYQNQQSINAIEKMIPEQNLCYYSNEVIQNSLPNEHNQNIYVVNMPNNIMNYQLPPNNLLQINNCSHGLVNNLQQLNLSFQQQFSPTFQIQDSILYHQPLLNQIHQSPYLQNSINNISNFSFFNQNNQSISSPNFMMNVQNQYNSPKNLNNVILPELYSNKKETPSRRIFTNGFVQEPQINKYQCIKMPGLQQQQQESLKCKESNFQEYSFHHQNNILCNDQKLQSFNKHKNNGSTHIKVQNILEALNVNKNQQIKEIKIPNTKQKNQEQSPSFLKKQKRFQHQDENPQFRQNKIEFSQKKKPAYKFERDNRPILSLQKRKKYEYQQKKRFDEKFQVKPKSINNQYKVIKKIKHFAMYDKQIGKGTFASVYLGQNLKTQQKVAIKQISLKKKKDLLQAEFLKQIKHPNFIGLYDYQIDELNKRCYLILEYCPQNLRQKIEKLKIEHKQQRDRLKIKINYIEQLIEGISLLNEKGFLHRDLKFENILVKDGILKICDFGLCRRLNQNLQLQSVRCGTPYTMAPEIYFHSKQSKNKPKYTEKADIYSLAVIFNEFLYEMHPFDYDETILKEGKRIGKLKIQMLLRIYKDRYGLNIDWIEEIIQKGLKPVQQRLTWDQVMKIYKNRNNNKILNNLQQKILTKENKQKQSKQISTIQQKKKLQDDQKNDTELNHNFMKKQPKFPKIQQFRDILRIKKNQRKEQQQIKKKNQLNIIEESRKLFVQQLKCKRKENQFNEGVNQNILIRKQPRYQQAKQKINNRFDKSLINKNNSILKQNNALKAYNPRKIQFKEQLKPLRSQKMQNIQRVPNLKINPCNKPELIKKQVISEECSKKKQSKMQENKILQNNNVKNNEYKQDGGMSISNFLLLISVVMFLLLLIERVFVKKLTIINLS